MTAPIPASILAAGARRVLEERLLLGEAEGDDRAVDGDRATRDDERLVGGCALSGRRWPARRRRVARGRGRAAGDRRRRLAARRRRSAGVAGGSTADRLAARLRLGRRAWVPRLGRCWACAGRGVALGGWPATRRPVGRTRRRSSGSAWRGAARGGRSAGSASTVARGRAGSTGGSGTVRGADAGPSRRRGPAATSSDGRRRTRRATRAGVREHRELELEAQPTDAGPVGVDRGEPPPGGGEGGRIVARRRRVGQPGDQLGADGLDRLVEEGPDVAPALFERVEQRDAGRPIAAHKVIDEPSRPPRRRGRGDRGRDDSSIGSGAAESSWSSIDSASRMPPAASRAMRRTAAGSASVRRPSGCASSLPSISATVRRRTS